MLLVIGLTVQIIGLAKCDFDDVRYNQRILDWLGIRNLTFERKSDVAIAFGLVSAFLLAILLTSPT